MEVASLLGHNKVWSTSWQRPGAIFQIIQVGYTQQAHTHVRPSVVLIPVLLVTDERFPLRDDLGVYAQYFVGWHYKDFGIVRSLKGIVVEFDIPYAWCGVKYPRLLGFDKALFCGRVSTKQGSKVVRAEPFVCKQCKEVVGAVVYVWEKASWPSLSCVFAANKCADTWAFRTADGGMVVGVLSKVGVSYFVLCLDATKDISDVLQTIVLWSINLSKVHHERSISPAKG